MAAVTKLIDSTYFDGELLLVGQNVSAISAKIDASIATYEKELLEKVLGLDLYTLFIAAVYSDDAGFDAAAVVDRYKWIRDGHIYTYAGRNYKWIGLKNAQKQSPIAQYVYYWYRRYSTTQTNTDGESSSKKENAKTVSVDTKMVRAWNKMVKWNCDLAFMLGNLRDTGDNLVYPEWINPLSDTSMNADRLEVFDTINEFNG